MKPSAEVPKRIEAIAGRAPVFYQVSVCDDGQISGSGDASHDFSLFFFSHSFFLNELAQILLDLSDSAVDGSLTSRSHNDLIAVLSQYLYDSGTHCACS